MTSGKLSTTLSPHPDMVPLLERHGLTWEQFTRKGRLPKDLAWVVEKRRDIITELHLGGMPWARMVEITGLSLGAIERGTRAVGNTASRENRRACAARTAQARRGEKKPWLSKRLRQEWQEGKFEWCRQKRTPAQVAAWLASLTPEGRRRMRGVGAFVAPQKCTASRIWTRSSFERRAVILLDQDPEVQDYDYEKPLRVEGHRILPDFIVRYKDGRVVLVEVKPAWVFKKLSADHPIRSRLALAEQEAVRRSWGFEVWTEADRLKDCHDHRHPKR